MGWEKTGIIPKNRKSKKTEKTENTAQNRKARTKLEYQETNRQKPKNIIKTFKIPIPSEQSCPT